MSNNLQNVAFIRPGTTVYRVAWVSPDATLNVGDRVTVSECPDCRVNVLIRIADKSLHKLAHDRYYAMVEPDPGNEELT